MVPERGQGQYVNSIRMSDGSERLPPVPFDEADTRPQPARYITEPASVDTAPGLFDAVRAELGSEALPKKSDEPSPRQTAEGRFRREDVLGEGGEGRIYSAHDVLLGREVAVKVMYPARDGDHDQGLREARVLSKLDHPSIIPVHDLVHDESGARVLVMKLVRGRTLSQVLETSAQTPPSHALAFDILNVVVRLCEAVAHAHQMGVLHLDIKPSNVMVGGFGEVHLMDWGASIGLESISAHSPRMLGTPGFMAPEQMWGDPRMIDERADVYGLGAVLFYALTGAAPHDLDTWTLPGHLEGLVGIVRGTLHHDRGRRTSSVDELRRQIMEFQRGEAPIRPRVYPAGTWIIREGEAGDEAFIIDSGRCEVVQDRNGDLVHLREMGPGELFGELALFEEGVRTASVRALEDVHVQVIQYPTLMAELSRSRPWLRTLIEGLATRLRGRERSDSDSDPD